MGRASERPSESDAQAKRVVRRFCHTLAAAALIGGVTVALTEGHLTYSLVLRMAIAFAWALILFTAGALLLEER